MCGCGKPTKIAARTNTSVGQLKGEHIKFADRHSLRVNRPSARQQPRLKPDDEVSVSALHTWIRRHYPPKGICESCGKTKRTDYASKKGHDYIRPWTLAELREHYAELCRRCHLKLDGHPRWERAGMDSRRRRQSG